MLDIVYCSIAWMGICGIHDAKMDEWYSNSFQQAVQRSHKKDYLLELGATVTDL